jgi:hypothetical protein
MPVLFESHDCGKGYPVLVRSRTAVAIPQELNVLTMLRSGIVGDLQQIRDPTKSEYSIYAQDKRTRLV